MGSNPIPLTVTLTLTSKETVMTLEEMFEKNKDEYTEFERIPEADRRHPRSDLCGMLYLHEKLGGEGVMVSAGEHDEIFLAPDEDELEKLTEADVIYLHRCGVTMSEFGGLKMNV